MINDKEKVYLVKAEDWEGVYVRGVLVDEGHTVNEGRERVIYFVELAEDHNFDLRDLIEIELGKDECDRIEDCGSLPEAFKELNIREDDINV